MAGYTSRPYRGAADFPLLLDFARTNIAARGMHHTYFHPGDVTWQFYNLPATEDLHVWLGEPGLAAFAALESPGVLTFDIRHDIPFEDSPIEEILDWGEGRKRRMLAKDVDVPIAYSMLGATTLSVEVSDHDTERVTMLEARGYQRAERGGARFQLDLSLPARDPDLPPGFQLRYAMDGDAEERIDLHRDAWSVWGNSSATVEAYRRLRTAPNYEQELDVVLEAPDGRLVSYCICWADDRSGIATFEPVGTRVSHARQGLGRAMTLGALQRLRERGMRTATVGTASVNQPAMALYSSAGFEIISPWHYWSKPVTPS